MKNFGQNQDNVVEYVEALFPEDKTLQEIRYRCQQEGVPAIQVASMDGRHLEVLVRSMLAKNVVEIGTLGGYSGVCIARSLPADGKLYTFEYSAKHAEVARESFLRAGVLDKVEIFVGPAIENLPLISHRGPFDLVFIDADKESYPDYLDWAIDHLRIGGTVLGDNAFGWGGVVQEASSEDILGLQKFNARLAQDPQLCSTILPTGEGLAMGIKVKEKESHVSVNHYEKNASPLVYM